jgi:hypothetical protein
LILDALANGLQAEPGCEVDHCLDDMTKTISPRWRSSISAKPNSASPKTAATPTKHSSTTTNEPTTSAETSSTNSKHHLTSPRTRMRSVTRSQQPRPSATELSVYEQSPRSRGPSRPTGEPRRLCSACRHTSAEKKDARKLATGGIRRYSPNGTVAVGGAC